jgi:hypothetical protein
MRRVLGGFLCFLLVTFDIWAGRFLPDMQSPPPGPARHHYEVEPHGDCCDVARDIDCIRDILRGYELEHEYLLSVMERVPASVEASARWQLKRVVFSTRNYEGYLEWCLAVLR